MDKLIFATGNAGKMKEIREILGRPGLTILSQKEAGIYFFKMVYYTKLITVLYLLL